MHQWPAASPDLGDGLAAASGDDSAYGDRRANRSLMGQAIGQVLSLGVGVALSPVPIIAVVLMLATPKGRTNGPAFLVGWIVGLAVAGTIVLVISSGASASTNGAPATWVSILKIVLGILLVLLAGKQWRGRPRRDSEPQLPAWMKTIDKFTPARSAAMGVALSAINPKNLLLVIGAAAAIAQTGAEALSQAVALAVFIVIATLGVGAPVAIYFAMGDRATKLLGQLDDWMARENATIMAVICLIIGAKLIGDAISALAS
jgi:threonine/homoserine/homoserine lactone efflux protein